MKGYVKALIGAGAAAIGGIVTLGILGREEKINVVDADFDEGVFDEAEEELETERETKED